MVSQQAGSGVSAAAMSTVVMLQQLSLLSYVRGVEDHNGTLSAISQAFSFANLYMSSPFTAGRRAAAEPPQDDSQVVDGGDYDDSQTTGVRRWRWRALEDEDELLGVPCHAATDAFGCCADGMTVRDDVLGSNCPLSCQDTQTGCCRDGQGAVPGQPRTHAGRREV